MPTTEKAIRVLIVDDNRDGADAYVRREAFAADLRDQAKELISDDEMPRSDYCLVVRRSPSSSLAAGTTLLIMLSAFLTARQSTSVWN